MRPDEKYFYPLGDSKDYMYFKPGTWWVYKNVNTNLMDTIIVTSSRLDTLTVKGSEDYSYQRIYTYESATVYAKSLRYNMDYSWYSREKNPDATDVSPQSRIWNRTRTAYYISQCFATPLELHDRPDVDLIAKDSSIFIGSKLYDQVQVFKIPHAPGYYDILDPIPYNNKSYSLLFYARNYGLVKSYKDFENLTIELVDSHVIQ